MSDRWDGLEEIVALADAGSFTRAAAVLGLSVSHMSRAIARLEARLETKLVHRTTRRILLSETGRALVEQSRRIIADRDALLSSARGSGEPSGELRVTCSVALGDRYVGPLLARYVAANPRLSVRLDLSNRVFDILGEGFDMAIRTGEVQDARLVGVPLATRSIETCASPAYLARAGTPAAIEDLAGHECLVGTLDRWRFAVGGVERTVRAQGRMRCNSGAVIAAAAAAGMGICQLPVFHVRDLLASGRLCSVLDAYRSAPETVFAVYPSARHLLPRMRYLVEALSRDLQGAIDRGPEPPA